MPPLEGVCVNNAHCSATGYHSLREIEGVWQADHRNEQNEEGKGERKESREQYGAFCELKLGSGSTASYASTRFDSPEEHVH